VRPRYPGPALLSSLFSLVNGLLQPAFSLSASNRSFLHRNSCTSFILLYNFMLLSTDDFWTTARAPMQHNHRLPQSADDISRYFSAANLPSQQELLGQIVVDILRAGQNVNRKSICTKLLRRLELSASQEEERLCRELIGLLFGR
jgi:hypothetical protein